MFCLDLSLKKIAGPVVILSPPKPTAPARLMLSNKVIFTDGTEMVLAAPTRLLWAGADGTAFDVKPDSPWQRMASKRSSGVITL